MILTLEPTDKFFMADDVMVRMWEGRDHQGFPCIALITAVAFTGQAEAVVEGLVSIPPPDEESARAWAHKIMTKQT